MKLQVPGASLYYEVRGSGPVLLMMPGGPADARAFRHIGEPLATDYTVVTYDPRGLSHSTLDAPVQDERIVEIFADDVHRLLTAAASARRADTGAARGDGAVSAQHGVLARALLPRHRRLRTRLQRPEGRFNPYRRGGGRRIAWTARP